LEVFVKNFSNNLKEKNMDTELKLEYFYKNNNDKLFLNTVRFNKDH
jgi:hypothetical protein